MPRSSLTPAAWTKTLDVLMMSSLRNVCYQHFVYCYVVGEQQYTTVFTAVQALFTIESIQPLNTLLHNEKII